jgi:hypothetical protein
MAIVRINTGLPVCDTCHILLFDIGDDEIYCINCDVGEHAMVDSKGRVKHCECCGEKLAVWFPYNQCPDCYSKPASGVFRLSEKYQRIVK